MQLILIRHGHADLGMVDERRPLSSKGREQARRMGEFLRAAGGLPSNQVWHSSLDRARQTAEILSAEVGGLNLREVDHLRPEDRPQLIAQRVLAEGESRVLVGHQPHLGSLAALLTSGSAERDVVEMVKCGALCLSGSPRLVDGGWTIKWFITPAFFGLDY
jgi:phosphohistidine phosphatase